MGGEQSVNSSVHSLESSDITSEDVKNLQFIKQINNVRYGEAKVVQNMSTCQLFAVKTILSGSKHEFEQSLEASRERHQMLQIPQIARLLDIRTEVNQHMCSRFYKITLLYEFFDDSLEKSLFLKRQTNQLPFSENEVLMFLRDILTALGSFQLLGMRHCDIRPKTILHFPTNGSFKITDLNFLFYNQPTPLKQTMLGAASYHQMYLSPENLAALKNRNFNKMNNENGSQEKSDVFSIGLVALEMLTLVEITQLIDFDSLELRHNNIEIFLEVIQENYSQEFRTLLQEMLAVDPQNRASFERIQFLINNLIPATRSNQQELLNQTTSSYAPPRMITTAFKPISFVPKQLGSENNSLNISKASSQASLLPSKAVEYNPQEYPPTKSPSIKCISKQRSENILQGQDQNNKCSQQTNHSKTQEYRGNYSQSKEESKQKSTRTLEEVQINNCESNQYDGDLLLDPKEILRAEINQLVCQDQTSKEFSKKSSCSQSNIASHESIAKSTRLKIIEIEQSSNQANIKKEQQKYEENVQNSAQTTTKFKPQIPLLFQDPTHDDDYKVLPQHWQSNPGQIVMHSQTHNKSDNFTRNKVTQIKSKLIVDPENATRSRFNAENNQKQQQKEAVIDFKISGQKQLLAQLLNLDHNVSSVIQQSHTIKKQFHKTRDDDSSHNEKENLGIRRQKQKLDLKPEWQLDHSPMRITLNERSLNTGREEYSTTNTSGLLAAADLSNRTAFDDLSQFAVKDLSPQVARQPSSNSNAQKDVSPYSKKYLLPRVARGEGESFLNRNKNENNFQTQSGQQMIYLHEQEALNCQLGERKQKNKQYQALDQILGKKLSPTSQRGNGKFPKESMFLGDGHQQICSHQMAQNSFNLQSHKLSFKSSCSSFLRDQTQNMSSFNSHSDKSNIALYELYLKEYQNMIRKTTENNQD